MGGAEAAGGVLLQAVVHDALEAERDPLVDARGLGRVRAQDGGHRLRRRLAPERPLPGQHLVEHGAEGEDVGPRVGLLAPHLLGRHVADRAEHRPGLRARGEGGRDAVVAARGEEARGLAREAEVEHLHAPLAGHEHVVRLHVAVHDALVVRGGEGLGELQGVVGGPARGERPRGEPVAEGLPLEELHRGEGLAAVGPEVVDGEDAGVRQRGHRARLALESLAQLGAAGHGLRQHLQGDVAPEPRVGRAVHLAHASRAEGRHDAVGSEAAAGLEGHGLFPGTLPASLGQSEQADNPPHARSHDDDSEGARRSSGRRHSDPTIA